MYSRETYERGLRIPPRYSGTAFRKENNAIRDAVGRPSAIPEEKPLQEELSSAPPKEIIKTPPPVPIEHEKEEKPTIQNITKNYSDEIIIGALIFSLIGGDTGGEEDITLLLLLLLLIL